MFTVVLQYLLCTSVLVLPIADVEFQACSSQIDGQFCQHRCKVKDFQSSVVFQRDGADKGVCFAQNICNTVIPGYSIFTYGQNEVRLNITSYSRTRDPGPWTCSYGTTTSAHVTTGYAILPNNATVTNGNDLIVNVTTDLTIITACAYRINYGITKLNGKKFQMNCLNISHGECAVGTGEEYRCIAKLEPYGVSPGTYPLEFSVNLSHVGYHPVIKLSHQVNVTFVPSLVTTEAYPTTEPSEIFSSTTSVNGEQTTKNKSNTSWLQKDKYKLIGIVVGFVGFVGIICAVIGVVLWKRKHSNKNNDVKAKYVVSGMNDDRATK